MAEMECGDGGWLGAKAVAFSTTSSGSEVRLARGRSFLEQPRSVSIPTPSPSIPARSQSK